MKKVAVDFQKKEIVVSAKFLRQSRVVGSDEYNMMLRLMKDLPDYQIVVQRAAVNVKRPFQPTYAAMEEMIRMTAEDPASALEEFARVRMAAYIHKSPYHYVLRWFRDNYVDAAGCFAA